MEKLIRNNWRREPSSPFERTTILRHDIHPEGLDIERIRFVAAGSFGPSPRVGHIISILKGAAVLLMADDPRQPLQVGEGVHLYLPPGRESRFDAEPGTELVKVSAATAWQARGERLLVRDEAFVAASATSSQQLRWVLTPQYLSRRIFLHHDPVLLSRAGHPVSWFRTTMFDVAGLPDNEEGEPVFKMSYNSRTECNVCYDVSGTARVRMAHHPYADRGQLWGPWNVLDGDSTYHLNEAAGGNDEDCILNEATGTRQFFRNKHEVFIRNGQVTLCCLFDPAPTGIERHRPGEYSDYEPLSQILGTEEYEHHRTEIAAYDDMVDQLSLAKALGSLSAFRETEIWARYVRGREAQAAIEARMVDALVAEGKGRENVLAPWMQSVAV